MGGLRKAPWAINLGERRLSIIALSLFSAWMLAFLFEGQILYSLTAAYDQLSDVLVFGGIAALFAGAFSCGFVIKTKKGAKHLFLGSNIFFIVTSIVFFFPPSMFWTVGMIASSFLAGGCVAAWGFFLRGGTPKNERLQTIADMLIFSNILMILLNTTAIHFSPHLGLALSLLALVGAFLVALKLPVDDIPGPSTRENEAKEPVSIAGLTVFLGLFVVIITINSGLMYHVINPAFEHLAWLASWYWAVPYVIALYVVRNLPRKANRTYMLYIAIAMIGLSFIGFMALDRSVSSYLVINTLMLGACGIFDLFWWSILGEMLDFDHNPAQILGIGLSANVLGVLLGGLIGNAIVSADVRSPNPTLLALAVVCVTFVIIPPLHKHLSGLLKDHAYLTAFTELPPVEQNRMTDRFSNFACLTERENQVASLLLKGKTYKMIAVELFISENTVKYYVKNIYAKFGTKSRAELITLLLNTQQQTL